ncbi:HD domain-containing protein [Saccharopolyspora phatthalungensis]|uniref:5'-deoxynucleotidase n=1 Tax=Saccharopolyspora phatthalungensis TaxID=664693 RepID=A0A840QHY3_9PSEU|nr:HD domain-containing protein [Saccharopolyspora phatthalungensis]MBB5159660.1 putative hydrolase of HD superfamily [Saccharopolyspora phatthalungensis]
MPDQRFAEIIAFAYETGHLKHTPRTGWLLGGVRNGESVAEHSYRVGVLAYVIAACEGANAERAATLGLFHDLPETRIGDIPSVGKKYVTTASAHELISEQTSGLPENLRDRIIAAIDEHESAKTGDATLEAQCSRDADKLECLLQAREYQREGYTQLDEWVRSSAEAMTTITGKALASAAMEVSPGEWWGSFASAVGRP